MDSQIDDELRNELILFKNNVLSENSTNYTDDGILREEVLDIMVVNKPITIEEFHQKIPLRLRDKTAPGQMTYLSEIFGIIKKYQAN